MITIMNGTGAGGVAGHFARQMRKERLDGVFPARRGWFSDWLTESREWAEIPATFRSWPDYEGRAATIRAWSPGILGGLVQTEDYARALIAVQPGVTAEVTSQRLGVRAERQGRVLERPDNPPSVWVVADDAAWCEHMAAGGVCTDPRIVSRLAQRFDSLRGESYRASESLAMIDRVAELWSAGVNPLTQTATAASV